MYIVKNQNDSSRYPYIICDGWGGRVYLTEKDLKKLKKEIEKILVDKIK